MCLNEQGLCVRAPESQVKEVTRSSGVSPRSPDHSPSRLMMSPPQARKAGARENGTDGTSLGWRGVHAITRWGPPGLLNILKPWGTDGSCPL